MATLYASWPALQKPDAKFRLYLSADQESQKAKTDGLLIEMTRRPAKAQKLNRANNRLLRANAAWKVKSKPFSAKTVFSDLKIGRVEEFRAPRGRNRASYAIAIEGLDPQTSYYLLLEPFKGTKAAASLEAYCVVTTCPGHDEGDNE